MFVGLNSRQDYWHESFRLLFENQEQHKRGDLLNDLILLPYQITLDKILYFLPSEVTVFSSAAWSLSIKSKIMNRMKILLLRVMPVVITVYQLQQAFIVILIQRVSGPGFLLCCFIQLLQNALHHVVRLFDTSNIDCCLLDKFHIKGKGIFFIPCCI